MLKIEDIFSNLPELQTERTILRKLTMDDAEDIFAYCSDAEVAKYTSWYAHQSIEDAVKFIAFVLDRYDNNDIAPWGIEDKETKRLIGTCGYITWNIAHSKAEIGYALSREFWNKGYMTEVTKRVIQFGFETMQLVRIEARCHVENICSARVMEKSGMQFEGILRKHIYAKGKHEDMKIYAIVKN